MRIILLVISILGNIIVSNAQYLQRIDSLKANLSDEDVNLRVDQLYKIAWEYRYSTPDSTIKFAKKALDLARQHKLKDKQAKAYNFIGIAYHYKGDYVNSFDHLSKAMGESKILNDSIQYGHSLNTLGRLFMAQGDLVKAYNYFFNARQVFENLNNQVALSYSYKSLAELYQNQKNIPKALEMLHESLRIRQQINHERGEISILNELASLYTTEGNYQKAFEYFLSARKIAERINDKVNLAEINSGIATVYYDQSKYKEASDYADEAMLVVEQTDNDDLRTRIYLLKGKISLGLNKIEDGKLFLLKVIDLSQESGNKDTEMQAYFHLSQLAELENNVALSYKYFKKFFNLRKSLEDADEARKIERLEARLEIEKREQENEILMAMQSRDKAVIERQQVTNVALIIISLIITAFMIHLWITAKKRRRDNKLLEGQKERIDIQKAEITQQNEKINHQNVKLHKRNKDLAHLNDEKDNLMNIMAHDLKGPFNRIAGLIELIKMTEKDNKDRDKYLEMIKTVSIGGIALIRDLLDVHSYEAESRVMNLIKVDLDSFLNLKVADFQRELESKGLHVDIAVEDSVSAFYSDEMYLSRIMDNLISNAIKFSHHNSSIFIAAKQEDEDVLISIKDHGQGFTEEDKKFLFQKFRKLSARPTGGESSNGLGLAIVKNLIDQLNGEIILSSEKGKGSEFIVKFPLKQHASISLT